MKQLISVQPSDNANPARFEHWQDEVDTLLNDPLYTFVAITHEVSTAISGNIVSVPVAWFIKSQPD